jgi:hypothetical protein
MPLILKKKKKWYKSQKFFRTSSLPNTNASLQPQNLTVLKYAQIPARIAKNPYTRQPGWQKQDLI